MGHRLLVVTGGDETLQSLASTLGDAMDVSLVESANEALWEMRDTPPQAILANLDLPDMSGLDMADILPNFGVTTRIILWSREESAAARQDASDHGVYRYLSGATSADALQQTLEEAMRQAETDAQQVESVPDEPVPSEPAPAPRQPISAPTVARIERVTPTLQALEQPESPTSGLSPLGRRIIPNPDPPYQPPVRSPRKVSPAPQRPERSINERVSARARNTAPPPVEPPPEPMPPPVASRRGRNLIVTQANLAPIQTILSDLWQELGAQCTLLTDRAYGAVLAEHGSTEGLPIRALLPLLSTSFSTASEVGRHLRDEDATTLYIHDAARYALYCFDIAQQFLLVIIFDKNIAATRIGSVWVESRSTIRKLKEALR